MIFSLKKIARFIIKKTRKRYEHLKEPIVSNFGEFVQISAKDTLG